MSFPLMMRLRFQDRMQYILQSALAYDLLLLLSTRTVFLRQLRPNVRIGRSRLSHSSSSSPKLELQQSSCNTAFYHPLVKTGFPWSCYALFFTAWGRICLYAHKSNGRCETSLVRSNLQSLSLSMSDPEYRRVNPCPLDNHSVPVRLSILCLYLLPVLFSRRLYGQLPFSGAASLTRGQPP